MSQMARVEMYTDSKWPLWVIREFGLCMEDRVGAAAAGGSKGLRTFKSCWDAWPERFVANAEEWGWMGKAVLVGEHCGECRLSPMDSTKHEATCELLVPCICCALPALFASFYSYLHLDPCVLTCALLAAPLWFRKLLMQFQVSVWA